MVKVVTKQTKKIKKLMIDKDLSGSEIARRIGVDPSMVSLTIGGQRSTYRIRKAIAEALGVDVTDLWPRETARTSRPHKER